jgi:SAM-dependent methyltransferase
MTLIDKVHGNYVFGRRVRVLSQALGQLLPADGTVLDVGCGDGLIDSLIQRHRPGLQIEGIDVLVRDHTHVPVRKFDGARLPCDDQSVDTVMFIDVLHHTIDPMVLLREARRVARRWVILKDHTLNGFLAGPTLRFMDWIGNARHGVALPYNYWPKTRWMHAFNELGLRVDSWITNVALYPASANWIFGRKLHFIARLRPDSLA